MSLEDKLAAIRKIAAERFPADHYATMLKRTEELQASGIIEQAIQVGDTLPAFELPNADGDYVRSNDLLKQGAVVLTVFRGHW